MVNKHAAHAQGLTVAHLNTFIDALNANIIGSQLTEEAIQDLRADLGRQLFPAKGTSEGVFLDQSPQLPATLEDLEKLVAKSKRTIRGGNESPITTDHAEQLEYNRIFDGALATVKEALGQAR